MKKAWTVGGWVFGRREVVKIFFETLGLVVFVFGVMLVLVLTFAGFRFLLGV